MYTKFDPAEIVGTNLKRLIKESGMSQEEFAEAAHVEPRTLRRWMCSLDSITHAYEAAKLLNVDVKALLGW